MKTKEVIQFEAGDKCFDLVHKVEAVVLYVHPKEKHILIEHTGDGSGYVTLKSPDEIETVEVAEMTIEKMSAALGKRVKIIE